VATRSASLAFAVGTSKPTSFPGSLYGVTFGSARSSWAVGSNDSLAYNPNGWTLIERWNGTGWG
jgi:hypothetical protein